MTSTNKNPNIKELLDLRERVRVELLGQEDPEYRQQVEDLLESVDLKIKEVTGTKL